eukprot:NODE_88_length_21789_cov_0.534440.p1 type:complete len:2302 gc:universal NODE_88_length_21789_cov_0.534440:11100-18005(+)
MYLRLHWTNILIAAIAGILLFWSFIVPLIIRYLVQTIQYDATINKIKVDVDEIVQYQADISVGLKIPTDVTVFVNTLNINNLIQLNVNENIHVENANRWQLSGNAKLNPDAIKTLLNTKDIGDININAAMGISKYIKFYDYLWIERTDKLPQIDYTKVLKNLRWSLSGLSVDVTSSGFNIIADVDLNNPIPIEIYIQLATLDIYLGKLKLGRGGVKNLVINEKITSVNAFLNLRDSWAEVREYLSNESNAINLLDNATLSGPINLYKNDRMINWLEAATSDLQISFGLKDFLKVFLTGFFNIKNFLKTVEVTVSNTGKYLNVHIAFPFDVEHIHEFHLSKNLKFNVFHKSLKIASVEADPDLTNNRVNLDLNMEFFNFEKLNDVIYDYLILNKINSEELLNNIYIGEVQFSRRDCEWCHLMLKDFRLSLDFLSGLDNSPIFDQVIEIIQNLIQIKNINSIQSQSYSGFDAVAHVKLSNAFKKLNIHLDDVFIAIKHKYEFVQLKIKKLSVNSGWNSIPCIVPFLHTSKDFADLVHSLLYLKAPIIFISSLKLGLVDLSVDIPIDLSWFFPDPVTLHDYVTFNISSIDLNMNIYNSFSAIISLKLFSRIPLHVKTNDISVALSLNEDSMFDVKLSSLDMPIGNSDFKFKSLVTFGNTSIEKASNYVDGIVYNYEPNYDLALRNLYLMGGSPIDLFKDVNLPYKLMDAVHGSSVVSAAKLITPTQDFEISVKKAYVRALPNSLLGVQIAIEALNPIPVKLFIPNVKFELGIGDITIMSGTVHSFDMQRNEFLFEADISVKFNNELNTQNVLAQFMERALDPESVENLPVWVNGIGMAPSDKHYTVILTALKVYFKRFLTYSSAQLVTYLKRTVINLKSLAVTLSNNLVVDLDIGLSLPFDFKIDVNFISLNVLLDSAKVISVVLENVKLSSSNGKLHLIVDFFDVPEIKNIFNDPLITICGLVIGHSSTDVILALQKINIGSRASVFSNVIRLPQLIVPELKINDVDLRMASGGNFDLSLDLNLNLNIDVSIIIPSIHLIFMLNQDRVIKLEISHFMLNAGKLSKLQIHGEFINEAHGDFHLFKSLPGSIGITDLILKSSTKIVTGLKFLDIHVPLFLIQYLKVVLNWKPEFSLDHVEVTSIPKGLIIKPSAKFVSMFKVFIPFASAALKIAGEPFVNVEIDNILKDNLILKIVFFEDIGKHNAIQEFLTNGRDLQLSLSDIEFGTRLHRSKTLRQLRFFADINGDILLKLASIVAQYIPKNLLNTIGLKSFKLHQNQKSLLGSLEIYHPWLKIVNLNFLDFKLSLGQNLKMLDLASNLKLEKNLDIHYSLDFFDELESQKAWNNLFENRYLEIDSIELNGVRILSSISFTIPTFNIPQLPVPQIDLQRFKINTFHIDDNVFINFEYSIENFTIELDKLSVGVLVDDALILNSFLSLSHPVDLEVAFVDSDIAQQRVAKLVDCLLHKDCEKYKFGLRNLVIGDIRALQLCEININLGLDFTYPILDHLLSKLSNFVRKLHLKFMEETLIVNEMTTFVSFKLDFPFSVSIPHVRLDLFSNVKLMAVTASLHESLTIDAQVFFENNENSIRDVANIFSNPQAVLLFIQNLEFGNSKLISIFKQSLIPIPLSHLNIPKITYPKFEKVKFSSLSLTQSNDFNIHAYFDFHGFGLNFNFSNINLNFRLDKKEVMAVSISKLTNREIELDVRFLDFISQDMLDLNFIGISNLVFADNSILSAVTLDLKNEYSIIDIWNKFGKTAGDFKYIFGHTSITVDNQDNPLELKSSGSFQSAFPNVNLKNVGVNVQISNHLFGSFNVNNIDSNGSDFYLALRGNLYNHPSIEKSIREIYLNVLNHKTLPDINIGFSDLNIGNMPYLSRLLIEIPIRHLFPKNAELQIPKISNVGLEDIQLNIVDNNKLDLDVKVNLVNPFNASLNIDKAVANLYLGNDLFTIAEVRHLEIGPGETSIPLHVLCSFEDSESIGSHISNIVHRILYNDNIVETASIRNVEFGNSKSLFSLISLVDIGIQVGQKIPIVQPYLEILQVRGEVNTKGISVSARIKISPELAGNIFGISAVLYHTEIKQNFLSLQVDNLVLSEGTVDALISFPSVAAIKNIWDKSVKKENIFEALEIQKVQILGPESTSLNFLEHASLRLPKFYGSELVGYFSPKNLFKLLVNVYVPVHVPFDVEIDFHHFYFEAWDYVDSNRSRLDYIVATVDEQFMFDSKENGARLAAKFSGSFLKLGNIIWRMNKAKGLKNIKVFHPVEGEIPWITKLNEVGFFFRGELRLRNPDIKQLDSFNQTQNK